MDVNTCENAVEAFGSAEEAFLKTVFAVVVRETFKIHLFTSKKQTFVFVENCRSEGKDFKLCNPKQPAKLCKLFRERSSRQKLLWYDSLMQEVPLKVLRKV